MWSKANVNKGENRRQALKGIGLGLAAGAAGALGGEQIPNRDAEFVPISNVSVAASSSLPVHADEEWLIDIARANLWR